MSLSRRIGMAIFSMVLATALVQQSAFCGALPVSDEPSKISDTTLVRWIETMSEGLAEAAKRDRPIVLVFTEAATNRHEWFFNDYARAFVNHSDVVCVRLLAPQAPNIPANATPQQRQLYSDAYAKLQKRYADLIRKYNVTMLPTVLFLTPDGETVLRSYARTAETAVVQYFRPLLSDFENYKKTREALHKALKEKGLPTMVKGELPAGSPVPSGPLEFGPPIKWHETMASALAEAAKVDRPIMLVLGGGDFNRHEWFYGVIGRKTVNESGVVPVRILPPAEIFVSREADPAVIDLHRSLKEQLIKEYNAFVGKYGVTSIPTILFLSPDGEQILASHTRVMESAVIDYFKVLPGEFENYKKLRAIIREGEGGK